MIALGKAGSAVEMVGTCGVTRQRGILYIVVILLIGTVAFLRGVISLFVAEDFAWLVAASSGVQTWSSLLAFQFRPIPFLVDLAVFRAFGPNSVPYHVVSLLFHLASSVLVFYLGKLITGQASVGGIAGLVFSVYVRHDITVVWMGANYYLFMTFFYLLAFYAFLRFLQQRARAHYIASLAFFALAILSNEAAITLIPMLFVIEALLRPENFRQLRQFLTPQTFAKYVPYVGIAGIYGALSLCLRTIAPLSGQGDGYHLVGVGLGEVQSFVAYIVYIVCPFIPLRTLDPNLATIGLSLVTLAVLIFLFMKGSREIRLCIIWMLVTVMPFVIFVPFGNSDRYFYLPSVGFSTLLGILLYRLYQSRKLGTPMRRAALILILSVYVIISVLVLQDRISKWTADGQETASVVSQVTHLHPRLPSNSRLYFVNLPSRFRRTRGCDLLRMGLENALRLHYGDRTLDVFYGSDPKIVAGLRAERGSPDSGPIPGIFVFLWGNDRVLEDKSERYAGLEGQFDQAVWEESFDLFESE